MKLHLPKLLALGVSAMSIASLTSPVYAETYAAVNGTETTFDKYLILDENANVPAAEFTFEITPGTAIAASENGMEVLAGPGNPAITSSAVFAPGDTTFDTAQPGDILRLAEGEKYAVKVLTADFSSVQFDEPGIYRYTIAETSSSITSVTKDEQPKTLDVYVIDNEGSLQVASYVLHTGTNAPVKNANGGSGDVAEAGAALADKVSGFINRFDSSDISIEKQVSGSQASRDKYFKFTLSVSNAGAGTKLAVDVTAGAESAPVKTAATVYTADEMASGNNVTELICQADGTLSHDFYLKHGQTITVHQLPKGADYSLSEVNEDYVSAALNTVDETKYSANSGAIESDDVAIGFQNTRDGIVPTGIALSIMPYVLLVIMGFIGFRLTNSRHARP